MGQWWHLADEPTDLALIPCELAIPGELVIPIPKTRPTSCLFYVPSGNSGWPISQDAKKDCPSPKRESAN